MIWSYRRLVRRNSKGRRIYCSRERRFKYSFFSYIISKKNWNFKERVSSNRNNWLNRRKWLREWKSSSRRNRREICMSRRRLGRGRSRRRRMRRRRSNIRNSLGGRMRRVYPNSLCCWRRRESKWNRRHNFIGK